MQHHVLLAPHRVYFGTFRYFHVFTNTSAYAYIMYINENTRGARRGITENMCIKARWFQIFFQVSIIYSLSKSLNLLKKKKKIQGTVIAAALEFATNLQVNWRSLAEAGFFFTDTEWPLSHFLC